jgi:cytochrome c-type biogenesis protein CcmH/NrfG
MYPQTYQQPQADQLDDLAAAATSTSYYQPTRRRTTSTTANPVGTGFFAAVGAAPVLVAVIVLSLYLAYHWVRAEMTAEIRDAVEKAQRSTHATR